MPNIRLEATEEEFVYNNAGKDIGVIEKVHLESPTNLTDSVLKKVYAHAKDIPVRLYDVRLVSRNLYLYKVPAFMGKNDITVLDVGDTVIVDYLNIQPTNEPFILTAISTSPGQDLVVGDVPVPVGESERYIQTKYANSVHLRNDGAVVLTGAYVKPDDPGGEYETDTSFVLVLGGRQGTMGDTDNPVRFTLQDKLGPILQGDNEGTFVINRPELIQRAAIAKELVSESKTVLVGTPSEIDANREGSFAFEVEQDGDIYFGEGLVLDVGDGSKVGERKNATAQINVAKDFELKVDEENSIKFERGGTITLNNEKTSIVLDTTAPNGNIRLGGSSAREPLVFGYKMLRFIGALYTDIAKLGAVIGILPTADPSLLSQMLSKKNWTD